MNKLMKLINHQHLHNPGDFTDDQIIEMFLGACFRSKYTIRNYKRGIDLFRRFISYKPLDKVTWREVQAFAIGLEKGVINSNHKKLAPATIASLIAPLKSLYRWGSDPNIGFFKNNPTTPVRLPTIVINSKNNYLTRSEVILLLNQLKKQSKRNYLIGLSLVLLGLRVSELIQLQWKHFYTDPSELHIWLTVAKGKGNKQREVKVPKNLWQLLKNYRNSTHYNFDQQLLFPITVRQVERIICTAREDANLLKPVTPHWLRHTNATLALLNGASLKQVQENLGHTHINTTQRYIHTVAQIEKAAPDYVEKSIKELF